MSCLFSHHHRMPYFGGAFWKQIFEKNSSRKYSDGDWCHSWACWLYFQKSSDGDYFLRFLTHFFHDTFFWRLWQFSFYFFSLTFSGAQHSALKQWSGLRDVFSFLKKTSIIYWFCILEKTQLYTDFALSIDQSYSQENFFLKNKYFEN